MNLLRRSALRAAHRGWLLRHRSAFRATAAGARPRLLVDLSVILKNDARTGIQRVVRGYWHALANAHGLPFDVVPVFAGADHGYCYASFDLIDRPTSKDQRRPVAAGPGDMFLGLDLSAHYLPACTPQLSAWRAAGATVHIVVYDLLPLEHPSWFNSRSVRHFSRWFETVLTQADQALCISEDVRSRLQERISSLALLTPPALGRLHLSGDVGESVPSHGISPGAGRALAMASKYPTILMVGTVEPRKAHDVALDAFEWLWKVRPEDAPNLIIAGKPGWKTNDLQQRLEHHPLAGERLFWVRDASDEALVLLYQRCQALLFTSRAEGFGLPMIEAARHGRWVLARDLPVLREQGLSNLKFFVDDSPKALGLSIAELLPLAQSPPPAQAAHQRTWSDCLEEMVRELVPMQQARPSAERRPGTQSVP